MPRGDNGKGYAIASTDIEERGNPIPDDFDGRSVSKNAKLQTHQRMHGFGVERITRERKNGSIMDNFQSQKWRQ